MSFKMLRGANAIFPAECVILVNAGQARGHARRDSMRLRAADFRTVARTGNASLQ